MDNKFDTVYISFNIKATLDLVELQKKVCATYQLIPRSEFHITFAYLGKVTSDQVEVLGNLLLPTPKGDFEKVKVNGLGGAYEDSSCAVHFITDPRDIPLEFSRVFWISIDCTNSMLDFRNTLISTIISAGLPSTFLRPVFAPHITLGSGGPQNKSGDWSLWDIHSIEKKVTLEEIDCSSNLIVEDIHITSVAVHPKNLFKIS
jgi:2'-5' RNA ligase